MSRLTNWLRRIGGKAQDNPTQVARGGWNILAGVPWIKSDAIWESYGVAQMQSAYRKHALIYACVREIATSVAESRVDVGVETPDGWMSVPASPVLDLLQSPNEWYSYNDLLQVWVTRLVLTGKAYIWKWRNGAGAVAELWPIPSDWVRVKTGKGNTIIDAYEVKQDRGRYITVDAQDMFYARFVDPSSVWDGVGPLQAALHDYQLDSERENYLVEMLTNLKVPGLVLKQIEGVPLTEQQRRDLRASLHDQAGAGKRGQAAILPPGMSIEFPGVLSDMDWPKFTSLTETRICSAFGVPPILVGARAGLERSTYANYETARRSFYAETLRPLWAALADTLTRGLLRHEGEERLEIRFRTEDLPELQEDASRRAERASVLLRAGIITRNEARQMAGMEPTPDGDIYLMPINVVEQPIHTAEGQGSEEPDEVESTPNA